MKHLIKTALYLLALIIPATALAHDFEVNGIYYNINGISATVTYRGTSPYQYQDRYSGSVSIPSTVIYGGTTYPVTAIDDYAFYDCTSLTSIYIPSSVTTISSWAFYGCSSLASMTVASSNPKYDSRNNCKAIIETATNTLIAGCKNTTIPNTVTAIGEGAFAGCTSLTRINIPNSVTEIGGGAFSGCFSLTSIDIPNSVTILGGNNEYELYDVFANCTSLTDVSIGDSVTEIGYATFYECTSLKNIHIGNSVTTIDAEAFYGCTSLTSITLPKSIAYISSDAFSGCTALTIVNITDLDAWCRISTFGETVCGDDHGPSASNPLYFTNHLYVNGSEITDLIIPGSVPYIGGYVFECCPSLNSVSIPNTVKSIGWGAFYGCTGLTSVAIPNSTIGVGWDSFNNCTSLKALFIGNSVASIGLAAFYNCNSLTNIYSFSTTPPECFDNEWNWSSTFSDYSATLHVPAASLAAYFTAPEWSNFENIVGDAIETTGISVSSDSVDIKSGEQIELTATVTPANASCKEVTWYSTDTSVATVENGIVTAVSLGECDIYAYCMGMPAICHVSVNNRISLEQNEAMLLPNHMLVLNPTAPAMPAGFTVMSSDPTVAAARVMNGKVQIVGIKEGTTNITVASSDGTAQPATCLVTVYTESGDVDMDGFVNINDVTGLIDYLLGSETTSFKKANADLDGDGNVNINDVTTLIDQLLATSE